MGRDRAFGDPEPHAAVHGPNTPPQGYQGDYWKDGPQRHSMGYGEELSPQTAALVARATDGAGSIGQAAGGTEGESA